MKTLTAPNKFFSETMNWTPGWIWVEEPSMQGDISELVEKANLLIKSADTKQKVLELIEIYEGVLKIAPENRDALMGIAWYSCLIGLGYADEKGEKSKFFKKAITASERAMYLNPEFTRLIDQGKKVWEACRVLSKDELDTLFLWNTSVSSLWKDCLKGHEKILNLKWVKRAKKMLSVMMDIDPEWGNGTPYYAWANYYAGAPRIAGGDRKKAAEYYEKAIALGPEMPNFRRTRALLLHAKNRDREALKQDLNWVLSQDPQKDRQYFTYPYIVFLQREASDVLAHIDEYIQ